jgi:hypothetical protein
LGNNNNLKHLKESQRINIKNLPQEEVEEPDEYSQSLAMLEANLAA